MKKVILLLHVLFISSCGLQYTPVVNTTDITKVDFKNLKESERNCAYGILWFPPFPGSSSSAIEAAKNAKFSKIYAVDYKSDFFVLFNRNCSIVYGE